MLYGKVQPGGCIRAAKLAWQAVPDLCRGVNWIIRKVVSLGKGEPSSLLVLVKEPVPENR